MVWTNADNIPVVTRETYRDRSYRWVAGAQVSSGYFAAMKIPLVRRRAFDAHDTASSVPVAIICERLARTLWPDKDAVGEYVAVPDRATKAPPTWLQIV